MTFFTLTTLKTNIPNNVISVSVCTTFGMCTGVHVGLHSDLTQVLRYGKVENFIMWFRTALKLHLAISRREEKRKDKEVNKK